jgi:hypothetical protein
MQRTTNSVLRTTVFEAAMCFFYLFIFCIFIHKYIKYIIIYIKRSFVKILLVCKDMKRKGPVVVELSV